MGGGVGNTKDCHREFELGLQAIAQMFSKTILEKFKTQESWICGIWFSKGKERKKMGRSHGEKRA